MTISEGFPAVDPVKELNPGMDKEFQVDPISLDIASTREKESANILPKEPVEVAKEEEKKDDHDGLQSFKTAITVSGILVAVAGAIFAITKKLKEK